MFNKHIGIHTVIISQSQHFLVALCRYILICIFSVTVRHKTMEPKQRHSLTATLRIDCGVNIAGEEGMPSCSCRRDAEKVALLRT
jgi:hypothetical protein